MIHVSYQMFRHCEGKEAQDVGYVLHIEASEKSSPASTQHSCVSGILRMVLTSTKDSGSEMDMAPPNNWHLFKQRQRAGKSERVICQHKLCTVSAVVGWPSVGDTFHSKLCSCPHPWFGAVMNETVVRVLRRP